MEKKKENMPSLPSKRPGGMREATNDFVKVTARFVDPHTGLACHVAQSGSRDQAAVAWRERRKNLTGKSAYNI